MGSNWGAPTDFDTVCRRAAGRRRYNASRALRRLVRRWKVSELVWKYLRQYGWFRGIKARVARELGVHRGTISRDWRALCDDDDDPDDDDDDDLDDDDEDPDPDDDDDTAG
jgi:hypothetical protein